MEGIKNLVIDFGGVIINLTRNRCIEAFESLGVANIREQIVNNYQHKDLFMKIELGSITVAEFRDGIRHLTRQPLTDEQIDAAWIAMLDDVPDYKLDFCSTSASVTIRCCSAIRTRFIGSGRKRPVFPIKATMLPTFSIIFIFPTASIC